MVLIGKTLIHLHPRMLKAKFDWNWPYNSGEECVLILSMYFCNFVIISHWKRAGPFIWTNLNPLYLRMLCAKFCQVWLKLAQWFWKENFQISPMYFRYFVIIFPFKRAWPFIWANLNPPSSKDDFCKVWWKLVRWFWRSWFSNFVNVFLLFRTYVIISHWKRAGPFTWTNLNPLHPRMLCAKFGWNWLSGSGEEDF